MTATLRTPVALLVCSIGLALAAGGTPVRAQDLPTAVKAEIAQDIAICKSSGGVAASARRAVRTSDANQDGRADYLLDEGKLCQAAFCGSGGCSFVLFLSGPDGVKKAYAGLGVSPKMRPGFLTYVGASGRSKVRISGYNARE